MLNLQHVIGHLHEVVNGLEVEEVVVWDVDTDAEVEAGVAPIDDLVVPKLDKVCVFRISNCQNN